MNYRDKEKQKSQIILDEVIRAEGGGLYGDKSYPFVLKDGELNLWDGIREDALAYFDANSIAWWRGGRDNRPTGHLLSSQVACVNHLYWLRTRKDAATAITKALHPDVSEAVLIGKGYVDFEVVGAKNYLGELSHGRGANATAIDATMVAKKHDGGSILIAIEWKYTEHYGGKCLYKEARADIYDGFLDDPDCPLEVGDKRSVYYEPYYQLMRQTVLCWKMVQANEYGCDEYLHVHVIPQGNRELLDVNTSGHLSGDDMHSAWSSVLKTPSRYRIISPEQLLSPAMGLADTKSLAAYLGKRYWGSV